MQTRMRLAGAVLATLLALSATVVGQNDQKTNGTITVNGQSVCLTFAGGGSGQVQLSGTWTGTITWKATAKTSIPTETYRATNAGTGTTGTTSTGNGLFTFGAAGLARFCAEATAAITGTVAVDIVVSQGTGVSTAAGAGGGGDATAANQVTGNASLSSIDAKTPALVGGRQPVDGSGVTQPVSGTFWQATQPVSLAVAPTTPVTGTFWQATQPVSGTFWQATQPVSGTFWQATQPISGTVTANLAAGTNNIGDVDVLTLPALPAGTNNIGDVDVLTLPAITGSVTANAGTNLNTSALALSATQTDRTQKAQITDGTRDGTVKAASTAAQATDTSLVVALSPNSPIPAGTNAIGKLSANSGVDIGDVDVTSLPAITGTVTANQGTAAVAANRWPVYVTDGTNTMPTADVATRAQFGKVTDGTNTAAVKAASTAAAAADPSLVVGLSPNSPLPAGTSSIGRVTTENRVIDEQSATWTAATTVQATVAAVDGAPGTLNLDTTAAGCATLWMRPVASTATTGQIAFDVSFNSGTTWVQLSGSNGDQTWVDSDLAPHTSAYNGQEAGWRFPVQTFSKMRIRLAVGITGDSVVVSGRSVSEGCAPFAVVRQGDPQRLNVSARNYTSTLGTATWTSATAVDTRANVTVTSLSAVLVTIRPTGTITGGVITTELSDSASPASTDWFTSPGSAQISLAGMTVATGQTSITVSVPAATTLSVRLVTAITGTGSPGITLVMIPSSGAPVRTSTVNFKAGFTMTTATLGIGGVYTSAWFDNYNDGNMASVCYARSNVASAASGFVIQQTTDPSDSNFFISAYTATVNAASTTAAFANTYQRYWRIVYTNGGTGQTSFKIVCSLNPVQFVLTDSVGVTYTNPTIYTAYDAGVSGATTQRVTLSKERTYAASTTVKTATASGTAAFFEICGSGTTTVRVQRITVSGTVATAAIYGDLVIRKNSTAGTGGTATTLTGTPYDTGSGLSATAAVKYFTVLPTGGGALVGTIYSQTSYFPITGTVGQFVPQLERIWLDSDSEPPTLRGTAQCLAVGFGTAPANVPTMTVSVAWTEK